MTNEILLALAAVILPVITYFAGVYRTEKRLNNQDSKDRIDAVLSKYLELRNTGKDSGWNGLKRAGAANLANDQEIREVADRIRNHGEKYPLNSNIDLDSVDLKILFEGVVKNDLSFRNTPLEQLIEQTNA
jgi:hypothetical protein